MTGGPAHRTSMTQERAASTSRRASGGTQKAPSENPWPSIPNAQLKRAR